MKKQNKRIKILELTNFSSGICGVWQRAKQEALELSKRGYTVKIFSSNAIKGSQEIACSEEEIEGLVIERFEFKKLGGESMMEWDFEKEAMKYSPDIIIAHSYRHPHTLKALNVAEKLKAQGKNCKVFLVTHAPFERTDTRSFVSRIAVWAYDKFLASKRLNEFDKIIAITRWEIPYLLKLGVKKDKIVYIPNGIPEEFFKSRKQGKEENKALFLGRIAPIKNLETLIEAFSLIDDKSLTLEIVGPAEPSYLGYLKKLIKNKNLQKSIYFSRPIYDLLKKIKKIDSCKLFILPSKSEGMPQSLVEAMARSKIAIASNTPASRDLIINGQNGLLFEKNDAKELAEKIDWVLKSSEITLNRMGKQAARKVLRFKWSEIIKDLERLLAMS